MGHSYTCCFSIHSLAIHFPIIAQLYFQKLAKPINMCITTQEAVSYTVDSNYVDDRWLHYQLMFLLNDCFH